MQRGSTALVRAAFKGHRDVVELLLRNKAQIEHANEVSRGDEGKGADVEGKSCPWWCTVVGEQFVSVRDTD